MSARHFLLSLTDINGGPASGALAHTYVRSSTTPQPAYSDSGLTTPATNPIVADASGRFAFYLDDTLDYTIVIRSADNATTRAVGDYVAGAETITFIQDGTVLGTVEANKLLGGDGTGALDSIAIGTGLTLSASSLAVDTNTIATRAYADALFDAVDAEGATVETLAQLRALPSEGVRSVRVLGRVTPGDWGAPRVATWSGSNLSTLVASDEVTAGQGDGGVYVAPNSDKTGASGAWVFDFDGAVNPAWWGMLPNVAESDAAGLELNVVAFERALTMAENEVILPAGLIRLGREVSWFEEDITIRGFGSGGKFDVGAGIGTGLFGIHTTGAVLRPLRESAKFKGLYIGSGTARRAALRNTTALEYTAGIRIEAEDVAAPEGDSFHTQIEDVVIADQPGDGLLLVGRFYESQVNNVVTRGCKGHGVHITNGAETGRTNLATPGNITFTHTFSNNNQGHGFKVGTNSANDYGFRLVFINCESRYNEADPALCAVSADAFIHADEATWINGAFGGDNSSAVASQHAGAAVMGYGGLISGARFLNVTTPALVRAATSRATNGWEVRRPHIRGATSDHVVNIENSSCINITVEHTDTVGGITKAVNDGAIAYPGLRAFANGSWRINANTTFGSSSTVYGLGPGTFDGRLTANSFLKLGGVNTLAIASGAITVTRSTHYVDTEGAAASDDLDTINGGADGDILLLRTLVSTRDVVVKHATGNINLASGADKTLNTLSDSILLTNRGGSNWYQVGFTDV